MKAAARVRAALVLCAAVCLAAPGPVLAARKPLVLEPVLTERPEDLPVLAQAAACPVAVAVMTDSRRDPVTAGNVNGRAIRSAGDAQGFMRSFVDALAKRGVAPEYEAADGVSFDLQMVWVSGAATALTANVIVVVGTTGADGAVVHKTYRGRQVNMNWNDGNSEIQKVVDQAFGDALDQIGVDLRARCG